MENSTIDVGTIRTTVEEVLSPYSPYFSAEEKNSLRRLPTAEFFRLVTENIVLPIITGVFSAYGFEVVKPWLSNKGLLPKAETDKYLADIDQRLKVASSRKKLTAESWSSIQNSIQECLLRHGLPRRKAGVAATDIRKRLEGKIG